jgi:membrane-bound lytic murein transglycosylase F
MPRAATVACALASSLLLAHAAAAAEPSLGPVAADGKLTVLYVDAETPFLDRSAAGPTGFDYDVLQGFAARHGLEVEIVAVASTPELIPALAAGRGEVIAGGFSYTRERAAEALFTSAVTPQRTVAVSLAPAPPVDSVERLRQLRVGTVAGTTWESSAVAAGVPRERLDASFTLADDGLMAALRSRRVDAAVTGMFWALVQRRRDPGVQLGVLLGEPGYHGYAVQPGRKDLRDALDAYLASVRDTAGWYRLVIKHFGQEAPDLFRRARGV